MHVERPATVRSRERVGTAVVRGDEVGEAGLVVATAVVVPVDVVAGGVLEPSSDRALARVTLPSTRPSKTGSPVHEYTVMYMRTFVKSWMLRRIRFWVSLRHAASP
jgi:hypothetical protein